ncbi:MAG: hypothetical protein AAF709_26105, partial [Pseudomonadota bacterium]
KVKPINGSFREVCSAAALPFRHVQFDGAREDVELTMTGLSADRSRLPHELRVDIGVRCDDHVCEWAVAIDHGAISVRAKRFEIRELTVDPPGRHELPPEPARNLHD